MLNIERRHVEPDIVVLQLSGKIALGRESQQLEWQVEELLKENQKKIILGLAGVQYMAVRRKGL